MIKKVLKILKKSKGFMTAKGRFLDYTEIHRGIYGFLKGFVIQNPKKLVSKLNVTIMDFEQWEDSEGQYMDTLMIVGYASSKLFFTALAYIVTQLI